MKKTTSIWMLCARNTVNKLLGLLALSAAVQSILFLWKAVTVEEELTMILWVSHIPLIFLITLSMWTMTLTMPSLYRAGGTMQRLQTEKKDLYFTCVCYNFITYGILWGAQVLLLLALFHLYGHFAPAELFGHQTIGLTFYTDWFLHSLLPVSDWTRYVRNICLVLGLACAAAAVPLRTRKREKRYRTLVILLFIACVSFPAMAGAKLLDAVVSGVFLVVGSMSLRYAWDEDGEEPDHEAE